MFNGYTHFLPKDYYTNVNFISTNAFRREHIEKLKSWGVDAIVLHREEFKVTADFFLLKRDLTALGVPLRASNVNLALFDLTEWKEVP